jgi:hypothetical protein
MPTELLRARPDPVADADPLPETCAPDLSVCTEVCVCAEAPPCTDAELCAATVHAPNIPTKAIERMRFMSEGLLEGEFISLKIAIPLRTSILQMSKGSCFAMGMQFFNHIVTTLFISWLALPREKEPLLRASEN